MRNGDYILIIAPENYPGKKYRGRYVYEHQFVWWSKTGVLVPEGYIVHHINDDKHDNSFENLELISRKSHNRIHLFKNKKIPLLCAYCGISFLKEPRNFNHPRSKGQERFYCCRSHATTHHYALKKILSSNSAVEVRSC